ncbi:hypothetical protein K0M31_004299 [Melipona bicolor]|uniref:Uncharacterized protein n=1 Tax=Melipona bicolor TaxID=60889 RepID=A0AA40FWI2_9HYME|nr:hypothetical protein K0M31_004299 [Melipona bicolor]
MERPTEASQRHVADALSGSNNAGRIQKPEVRNRQGWRMARATAWLDFWNLHPAILSTSQFSEAHLRQPGIGFEHRQLAQWMIVNVKERKPISSVDREKERRGELVAGGSDVGGGSESVGLHRSDISRGIATAADRGNGAADWLLPDP